VVEIQEALTTYQLWIIEFEGSLCNHIYYVFLSIRISVDGSYTKETNLEQ